MRKGNHKIMLTEQYPELNINPANTAPIDPAAAIAQTTPGIADTQEIPAVNSGNTLAQRINRNRWRAGVIGTVSAVALGGAAYALVDWATSGGGEISAGALASSVAACSSSEISPIAFTGPNEILPPTATVDSNGLAKQYNEDLFHASSITATLGGKIDPGSEAIMAAVLGDPAVNGTSESNFSQTVTTLYGEMTGSN
ncbi:MAG TPA: hypothetical protein VGF75_07120, partial [Candidatus Saccharimonadales bacterium]